MRTVAGLAVARDPLMPARTRITRLRSDPPLTLRPTLALGPDPLPRWALRNPVHAWVALAASAAAPIGGDHLRLDVDVGEGATLVARNVAATLLLPGSRREPSRSEVTIHVGIDATLVWSAGPVIAAGGCDHSSSTRITLAPGARLLVVDEFVLGRHREACGSVRQRLRICLGDRPLYDQELAVGPSAPGADGPAVTGGRRAIGSMLIVDAQWATKSAFSIAEVSPDGTARLPLDGPAVLLTALGPDVLDLRRRLRTSLRELGADGDEPTSVRPAGAPVLSGHDDRRTWSEGDSPVSDAAH